MTTLHESNDRGKKRKKKRSHIQMAKKFARRRNHGTDIDSDTYQYMVRILELMKSDFPTLEEKLMFVNNVYQETIGHEVEYAQNQVGSRVLDSLLKFANLEAIQRLVDAFGSSLRPLSSDRFASHVLEKIVTVCAERGNRSSTEKSNSKGREDGIEVNDDEVKSYNNIVLRMSKYFINNMEEFLSDTYANHLLRTVIECLGGLIDKPEAEDKRKPAPRERRPVIQEYTDLLVQSCTRLLNQPQFLEFGQEELTSGFLQSVLLTLKEVNSDLLKKFVKKITQECFKPGENGELSNIFETESSIRLLEACLALSPPKYHHDIYEKFFAGNLQRLSVTRSTNFSVQRLMDHCPSKEDFEQIFDELSPHFPEILENGYTGVLSSVGSACQRLQTKQGPFVNIVTTMLKCEESEKQSQIALCIAALKTEEQLKALKGQGNSEMFVSLHGSLIIQAILNFNKPIKMINSLMEMNTEELVQLFGDPKGSRIVDAFMDSSYIGEKSREKLTKKLKGYWAQLAQGTHGSRSLDKIWAWARSNQKMFIMEELAAAGESLRSTKSGQLMSNKLNVPLFARNKKDWTEAVGKEEKTRTLFAGIIGKQDDKKEKKKK